MLLLKIIAQFVAAIGAVAALFGESRRRGKFTVHGWITLLMIAAGFIVSGFIEVIQTRREARELDVQRQLDSANQLFRLAEQDLLATVGLTLYQHREQPARELLDYARRIAITIGFSADARHPHPLNRILGFQPLTTHDDAEAAFALTATSGTESFRESGDHVELLTRAEHSLAPQPKDQGRVLPFTTSPSATGTSQSDDPGTLVGVTIGASTFYVGG